jgi:hypothetical protein
MTKEENERIAEVIAETIREAAKVAAEDVNSFIGLVEKTGDALVDRAEATARELRNVVERMKERMKTDMKKLSEEVERRSDELAGDSARYVRHCSEARETILAQHAKLNGAAPPLPEKIAEEIETEMKNLTAAAMKDAPPPATPHEYGPRGVPRPVRTPSRKGEGE